MFQEIGAFVESCFSDFGMDKKKFRGDGVATGIGTINGESIYVSVEEFTVMGGAYDEYYSRKIVRIMDMVFQSRAPFITINDSGGTCYGLALCDYVFMVEKTCQMFLTNLVVVKTVMINIEKLG